jgi:hypothetical protein
MANFSELSRISLERLSETTTNLIRIAGRSAEILIENIPNTNPDRYLDTILPGRKEAYVGHGAECACCSSLRALHQIT